MAFKPIYRNVQHVPRIWGLTYSKLFASLGAMLLVMLIWMAAVSQGPAALAAGTLTLAVALGLSGWLDRRDPLESRRPSAHGRDRLTALSLSDQTLTIRDGDAT